MKMISDNRYKITIKVISTILLNILNIIKILNLTEFEINI